MARALPPSCGDDRAEQLRRELAELLAQQAATSEVLHCWRRLGHRLGFAVGIAQGYATLGRIGFEGRWDYAAIGTVTNLAARLCDAADDGQILVSPRVHAGLDGLVAVDTVRELTLKGLSRPVAAHNVVGAGGDALRDTPRSSGRA